MAVRMRCTATSGLRSIPPSSARFRAVSKSSQGFTAPAPTVDGLYLGGYSSQDANPDIANPPRPTVSVIAESPMSGLASCAPYPPR